MAITHYDAKTGEPVAFHHAIDASKQLNKRCSEWAPTWKQEAAGGSMGSTVVQEAKVRMSIGGASGPGGTTFLKENIAGSGDPGGDDI
ncbi:hypothetical protein [Synechococcus sp. UW140]|uniref:hypothetical protein n=1 Tax=Synechococcus sp. UW140 TaxID=368503 RepID=UPI000E0F5A14|nr:hypothetical protein [Synechococcus sp. UW140]